MDFFQDFPGQKQNSGTFQDFSGCGHHDNRNTRKRMRNAFKVNNKNTRATSIGVFIVNFEDISHNISHNSVSIVDFEQVYVSWAKFHNPAGIFLFKVNNGKVQTHHLFPNFKKS